MSGKPMKLQKACTMKGAAKCPEKYFTITFKSFHLFEKRFVGICLSAR
jgi:hypothetical protein